MSAIYFYVRLRLVMDVYWIRITIIRYNILITSMGNLKNVKSITD